MKEAKKVQITDPVCKQIQLMLKGGAKQTEVGALMGIHPSTISKIAKAGFSVEKYLESKKAERERMKQETKPAEEQQPAEEQVPGQIRMKIPEKVEGAQINAVYADEISREYPENVKLMRFQAGQVDKLIMKLDKLNDTMSMILRTIRKE